MDDIFQSEAMTEEPTESNIALLLRETIREELKKREKKQKKKKKKKSKKKEKKSEKPSKWENLLFKFAHTAVENGLPALIHRWGIREK